MVLRFTFKILSRFLEEIQSIALPDKNVLLVISTEVTTQTTVTVCCVLTTLYLYKNMYCTYRDVTVTHRDRDGTVYSNFK